MTIPFHKTYCSPEELIKLLKDRGLLIYDDRLSISVLKRVGYYRLSAYLYPFLNMPKEQQMFKEGSSFEAAKALYDFDQHLRSLAFDEIAKIEVAVRSALANVVSNETGNAFWITDASSFAQRERYLNTKSVIDKELQQTKEEFINHFRSKYNPLDELETGILNPADRLAV